MLTGATGLRRLLLLNKDPHIQPIMNSNIFPRLMELLNEKYATLTRYEASWCLSLIANGNDSVIKLMIENDIISLLLKQLKDEYGALSDQAVWMLGNIGGENTVYRNLVISAGALPILGSILRNTKDISVIKNVYWTLSNLIRGTPKVPCEIIKDIFPSLINAICNYEDEELLMDCCWSLIFIIEDGIKEEHEALFTTPIIPRLIQLLSYVFTYI